jgi:hypothetical protein
MGRFSFFKAEEHMAQQQVTSDAMLATRVPTAVAPPSRLMLRTCKRRGTVTKDLAGGTVQRSRKQKYLDLELEELHVVNDLVKHRCLVGLQTKFHMIVSATVVISL